MAKGILDVSTILNEYSKDIQSEITETAINIAKTGVSELKNNSPKSIKKTSHRGKYAKGWRCNISKGTGFVECVIHNSTDWQLTHLLENEHATNNGGKYVPKKKHIEPVHDKCVKSYQEEVEKIIRGGK